MAGPSGNGNGFRPIVGINVTPLVDICLVLLIIFMVTASYIVALSIKVELPKAQTGEQVQVTTLSVTIDRDSRAYLNGRLLDDATLREAIRQELAAKKDVQMIVSADKKVEHGTVIRYIDLAKQLGVFKFALNIEEP